MRIWGLTCIAGLVAISAVLPRAQGTRIVIAASTIIDGRGAVLRDTRVVVDAGTIVAIDPNAAPIDYDLRGATLMPGWIDTHVHINWHFDVNHKSVSGGDKPEEAALSTADDAWATLMGGFTTVQSVGAMIDGVVRDHINLGLLPGPRILRRFVRSTTRAATPTRSARSFGRRRPTAPT